MPRMRDLNPDLHSDSVICSHYTTPSLLWKARKSNPTSLLAKQSRQPWYMAPHKTKKAPFLEEPINYQINCIFYDWLQYSIPTLPKILAVVVQSIFFQFIIFEIFIYLFFVLLTRVELVFFQ